MLERTDAITKEVLEPITFVLEYPTGTSKVFLYSLLGGVLRDANPGLP